MTPLSSVRDGQKLYFSPRAEGEANLVTEIRDLLRLSGVPVQLLQMYDSDPNIVAAQDKNATTQRYILNRYWTLQLQSTDKNTEQLRFYLFPEGQIHDWLKAFKLMIVPFLLENNLPRAIHGQ